MSIHTRLGRKALALFALIVLCFGTVRFARADDYAYETAPDQAKLTKVIVGPVNLDTSNDTYTFNFKGAGTVADQGDSLVSDDVVQDSTLKAGDTVPAIADVTLNGVGVLTSANALVKGDDSLAQATVSVSFNTILQNVTFPHAGIYTYEVSESATYRATQDGTYINPSRATYILRIRVSNDTTTGSGTNLTINNVDWVTLEQTVNDEGDDVTPTKVDPTYPRTVGGNTSIIETEKPGSSTIAEGAIAGNSRGLDVYGFTFANEYVGGGPVEVTKITAGQHADTTRLFDFTVTVTDTAAKDYPGCCITYTVKDASGANVVADRDRSNNSVFDGTENAQDYMSYFDSNNQAVIDLKLKDGDTFAITGLYGQLTDDTYTIDNKVYYRLRFTDGLKEGTSIKIQETSSLGYSPTGYVYDKTTNDPAPKPTIELNTDGTATVTNASSFKTEEGTSTAITLNEKVGAKGSSYFVVNSFDESKVSPTGIFVDNLPYIIMVSVPVAIFAFSFAARRRAHTA